MPLTLCSANCLIQKPTQKAYFFTCACFSAVSESLFPPKVEKKQTICFKDIHVCALRFLSSQKVERKRKAGDNLSKEVSHKSSSPSYYQTQNGIYSPPATCACAHIDPSICVAGEFQDSEEVY